MVEQLGKAGLLQTGHPVIRFDGLLGASEAGSKATALWPRVRLAVVVPCYNEEKVLPETTRRLSVLIRELKSSHRIAEESAVWFVDDGSSDNTWAILQEAAQREPCLHAIRLSRNRGHQNALLAGFDAAGGDAVITIDADLQDDLSVISEMVELHAKGIDIVCGIRRSRDTDTRFKRFSAEVYYRLLGRMGVEIVFNHADYRLMSRRALDALGQYSEVNMFLRGIIPQLGYPTAIVSYDRAERFAGESKYPLHRMLALALDGITSFSVVPLRMIAALGMLVSFASLVMIAWVVFGRLVLGNVIPGWASTVVPTYLLGGVQLCSIGVIGEYIGKIYLETKRRPRYFVQDKI